MEFNANSAAAREIAFLRAVIDAASSVAMIATDDTGLITLFSSGAERMLGYTAAEMVGHRTPDVLHLSSEVETRLTEFEGSGKIPAAFPQVFVTLCGAGISPASHWTMVRANGATLTARISVSVLRDGAGTIVGYLEVATDISDQVEQAQGLTRARRAAEAASRAKSEFLATMSHEIRTPMNGILGMAGLLLNSDLTHRQRKRVETLRNSGEALLAVLNDILDFSKIEASKLELEVADFDLRKLVEDVADLLGLRAQEKNVEMLCSIQPEVPTRLQGDPNRLRQVLTNLVGNAVKFTSRGSISLSVRLDDPPQAGVIRFEVTDSGIGIPESKRHLLFQPFSQADASTARRFGGTGLGLSIVAGLVKMLDGEVGVESVEGQGSTFWFTARLPVQQEVKRPRALSLSGARVLVVDDSEPGRALLCRLLVYWGCRPDEAGSPEEALGKLYASAGRRYDLVLIDLGMPSFPGDRLARIIRADPTLRHLRLVLMTDLRHSPDTSAWQEQGFDGRVTKPVKQGELGGCLATVLGHGPGIAQAPGVPVSRDVQVASRACRRLLLVEDNIVNQEVALGILENLGYPADVASDGRTAITLLTQNTYTAVLTDCELPELDGYQLTRLIRESAAGDRNREIPVIAMTAHALAGDREKCLQAGMDDYLSKPIDPAELEALVDRYTGVERSAPDAIPATVLSEVVPPPSFNPNELIDRLMGNEPLARRLIDRFVTDMPAQLGALANALRSEDRAEARLLAHSIKGASANVGGGSLSQVASNLESSVQDGDLPTANKTLLALDSEFHQTLTSFREFLDS